MTPRVAIVGGDERASRQQWPEGYDVRTYCSSRYAAGDISRFSDACKAGGIDFAVVLTKFLGHADERTVRATGIPFARWSRGISELAAHLDEVVGIEASASAEPVVDLNAWIAEHNERAAATTTTTATCNGGGTMDGDMMMPEPRTKATSTPSSAGTRRLGTIEDAAAMLGLSVGRTRKILVANTVYREEDPARGSGGKPRMLYDLDDVAALVDIRRSVSPRRHVAPPDPVAKAPAPAAIISQVSPATQAAVPSRANGLLAKVLAVNSEVRARRIKALVERLDAIDAKRAALDAERATVVAEIEFAMKSGGEV